MKIVRLYKSSIIQQIYHPYVTLLICHFHITTSHFSIFTKYSKDLEFFQNMKSYLSLSIYYIQFSNAS